MPSMDDEENTRGERPVKFSTVQTHVKRTSFPNPERNQWRLPRGAGASLNGCISGFRLGKVDVTILADQY